MTPHGQKLLGAIRRNFELLAEHDKAQPAEVDAILTAAIAHIRAWRPQTLLALQAEAGRG